MAALHRALALAEREHRAVRVGEQLDLDVPRPLEVALEVDAVVAEPGLRLAPGGGRARRRARRASGRCACRGRRRPAAALTISGGSVASGTVGTPASAAMRFASSLSPPRRSASAGGPTQVRPAASTASAKSPFSDEEPVAGMDRVRARLARPRGCAPRDRGTRRSRRSRRPTARAATPRRRVRRPRPCRGRARARRGRRAGRSPPGLRRAPSSRPGA